MIFVPSLFLPHRGVDGAWQNTGKGGGPKFFLNWLTFASSPYDPQLEDAISGPPEPGTCLFYEPRLHPTFTQKHKCKLDIL